MPKIMTRHSKAQRSGDCRVIRLYLWRETPKSILFEVVSKEVEIFEKRYGYKPWVVRVRADEMSDVDKFPEWIRVEIVERGIQPGHFQLGPLIYRTPRLSCERKPV